MTVAIVADLRPALHAVRDQGRRPTCLAHAVTLSHEHARQIGTGLSPEYLHYFANVANGGASTATISGALANHGQPTEADCPYLSTPPPARWTPPSGLTVFRYSSALESPTQGHIASCIRAGDIPVLGISLPEPFYAPTSPWIVDARGAVRGLHAVAAVGLGMLNAADLVLIRNSWGESWGDYGHAWLDDAFLRQHLKLVLSLKGAVQ